MPTQYAIAARAADQPSAFERLQDEHTISAEPLQRLVREADGLERRVSVVVNAVYGLTPPR